MSDPDGILELYYNKFFINVLDKQTNISRERNTGKNICAKGKFATSINLGWRLGIRPKYCNYDSCRPKKFTALQFYGLQEILIIHNRSFIIAFGLLVAPVNEVDRYPAFIKVGLMYRVFSFWSRKLDVKIFVKRYCNLGCK